MAHLVRDTGVTDGDDDAGDRHRANDVLNGEEVLIDDRQDDQHSED